MNMLRLAKALAVFLGLTATNAAVDDAMAQGGFGDITVTPTRIVLEGRQRSGTITLANTGAKKATYRISVVNMRMTENGGFQEIQEGKALPGENFAEGLFRYAPRQVTLEPGQAQTIRIATRKPAGLLPGEYRSHLLIRAIPDSSAGQSIERKPGDGIEVSLAVIAGVALPVIVRHGEVSAETSLSDFTYNPAPAAGSDGNASLAFRINRSGNASVYGDLAATYFAPQSDEGLLIGEINQLAVYIPNTHRLVKMLLVQPEGITLESGGRIVVTYRTPPKDGGRTIAVGEYRLK